jgi:hypothetical protein
MLSSWMNALRCPSRPPFKNFYWRQNNPWRGSGAGLDARPTHCAGHPGHPASGTMAFSLLTMVNASRKSRAVPPSDTAGILARILMARGERPARAVDNVGPQPLDSPKGWAVDIAPPHRKPLDAHAGMADCDWPEIRSVVDD